MSISILWFRRDLRLTDNPALLAAVEASDEVLPVFVRDPVLLTRGGRRVDRLEASLAALSADTGGALVVRTGDPADVITGLAAEVDAREVHVARESTPYGRRRDERVRAGLRRDGRSLVETVGYTLFIPVFFVVSGMGIDLRAVADTPWILVAAVASMLVIRGGGVWLSETVTAASPGLSTPRDRARVGLYAATGLPIIVAVTGVAVDNGLMKDEISMVLVAAGAVTVLLFPLLAELVRQGPAPDRTPGRRAEPAA